MSTRAGVLVGVVLAAGVAQAQSFAGTWSGPLGTLTLTQQGARVSGTATIGGVSGTLSGTVQGPAVSGVYQADGESGSWVGQLQGARGRPGGETLQVSFDDEAPAPFRRAGAAPAPVAARASAGPAPVPAERAEPAPKVAAAEGAEVRQDDGWSVRAPARWKPKLDGQRVLFASDTEAGLIIAGFQPGATFEELQQGAQQGFTDSGLVLTPAGAPQALEVRGARAVAVDMQTTAEDGTPLRARAAGVAGAPGAVVVIGFTTAEKFAGLRGRVDQVAKSVAFFAPKVGAGAQFLNGSLCSYSGGSVAAWTRRYNFDGRGRVSFGSEMTASGRFTNSGGDVTGGFGAAAGNQYNPTNAGTYSVQGNEVVLRLGGETVRCRINLRQNSGRITELMCGGRLYAPPLCD